ncbi:MAG: c-type cytochrome [Candidatus Competibacteraceae bacterium]|nr:c-type cytochrome [Candidatus Competibacteraceae bacterium]
MKQHRAIFAPPWWWISRVGFPDKQRGRRSIFFGKAVGLGSAALILGGVNGGPLALAEDAASLAPERARELVRMVRQDCGSCHGLTLRGGLGPALLPENLSARPLPALKYTILFGRPGTAMPPWQPFMTEAEAEWIVVQLLRGFPEESQ